jgi:hypothetical protein
MFPAPGYEELTAMPEEELIRRYNEISKGVAIPLEGFRFELWRRQSNGQVHWIIGLTVAVLVLTAVNAALAVAVFTKP